MTRRTRWMVTAATAVVAAVAIGGGVAAATGALDGDRPITGPARAKAQAAALAYTGGGRVTDTEVGDEESYYEVEVTMPDGRQIDVQLDEDFTVVGSSGDEHPGDEDPGDQGPGDDDGTDG